MKKQPPFASGKKHGKVRPHAMRGDEFRKLLVALAGESEEDWPQQGLVQVLDVMRLAYRGKRLGLPRRLDALVNDARWVFLLACIRDRALWAALLEIVYSRRMSRDDKVAAIIALAARVGIDLTEEEAAFFLPGRTADDGDSDDGDSDDGDSDDGDGDKPEPAPDPS